MSALPNPLQELAEKLRDEMFSRHMGKMDVCQRVADAFLPILTAAVGTLLQAERAAAQILQKEADVRQFPDFPECGLLYPVHIRARINDSPLATPEAASALSAVVQRETEKLREWKESASNILNQLDLQAIGKEIGLHLGQDVSPNVLPAIKKLKALLRRCYDMGNLPDKLETDIRAALQ